MTATAATAKRAPRSAATKARIARTLLARHRRIAEEQGASPLRLLRLERGLTVQEAAFNAVVHERTWRRAESELESVSEPTRLRIARSLAVPVEDIKG